MSDSLFDFAQQLKVAIVKNADGKDGDVNQIKNKDNLDAAGEVMLAPLTGKGKALFLRVNAYRERILNLIDDLHPEAHYSRQSLYNCSAKSAPSGQELAGIYV